MMKLYDDALLQYDELDALFTQFLQNHGQGETPDWLLSEMANVEVERYEGVDLNIRFDVQK